MKRQKPTPGENVFTVESESVFVPLVAAALLYATANNPTRALSIPGTVKAAFDVAQTWWDEAEKRYRKKRRRR